MCTNSPTICVRRFLTTPTIYTHTLYKSKSESNQPCRPCLTFALWPMRLMRGNKREQRMGTYIFFFLSRRFTLFFPAHVLFLFICLSVSSTRLLILYYSTRPFIPLCLCLCLCVCAHVCTHALACVWVCIITIDMLQATFADKHICKHMDKLEAIIKMTLNFPHMFRIVLLLLKNQICLWAVFLMQ